jgi:hypothetical protein
MHLHLLDRAGPDVQQYTAETTPKLRVVVIGDIVELLREPLLGLQRRLTLRRHQRHLGTRTRHAVISHTDLSGGDGSDGEVLPTR